jgi:hypothetical protein
MVKNFESRIWKDFDGWEHACGKENRDDDYLDPRSGEIDPTASEEEQSNQILFAERGLNAQVEFVRNYVCFMALDGPGAADLRRIRRFPAYQCRGYERRLLAVPWFEPAFRGGCYPGSTWRWIAGVGGLRICARLDKSE